MTLRDAVVEAARALQAAGLDDETARRDASTLARHILAWDAARWLASSTAAATPEFTATFSALTQRRAQREPLAYIIGEREFYGRPFAVTRDVLIPRPETELVIDAVLGVASGLAAPRVLDIGTGSGCLAVTVALELPDAQLTATDVSEPALALARANARRLGVEDRIEWRAGNLVAGAGGLFDIIMSNPPYVPERDRASLQPEVAEYEPASALFGGEDGLAVIRRLVPAAAPALARSGWLIVEIGYGHSGAVARIIAGTPGLRLVRFFSDLQAIPRVVVASAAAAKVPDL